MREDNGSGYKSTCANEETVDETGLSRERELAYELTTKGFGLSGLDWARFGLGWRLSVGLGLAWAAHARPRLGRAPMPRLGASLVLGLGRMLVPRLGAGLVLRRSSEQLLAGEEKGREEEGREGDGKEEKKRRRKRDPRGKGKREKKRKEFECSGFSG